MATGFLRKNFLFGLPDPHLFLLGSHGQHGKWDQRRQGENIQTGRQAAFADPGGQISVCLSAGHTAHHQGIKRCQWWGLKKAVSNINRRYLEQHSSIAQSSLNLEKGHVCTFWAAVPAMTSFFFSCSLSALDYGQCFLPRGEMERWPWPLALILVTGEHLALLRPRGGSVFNWITVTKFLFFFFHLETFMRELSLILYPNWKHTRKGILGTEIQPTQVNISQSHHM